MTRRPRVFLHLLQAQRDALLFLIDVEHHRPDGFALLQHFAGMADLLGPRQIGNMQQAVDAFFDLDERAVVGDVADFALDDRAGRILLGHALPRILLDLLHAQARFPACPC